MSETTLNIPVETQAAFVLVEFVDELRKTGAFENENAICFNLIEAARDSLKNAEQINESTVMWSVLFPEAVAFMQLVLVLVRDERIQQEILDFDLESFAKTLTREILKRPFSVFVRKQIDQDFPGYLAETDQDVDPGTVSFSPQATWN